MYLVVSTDAVAATGAGGADEMPCSSSVVSDDVEHIFFTIDYRGYQKRNKKHKT